MTKGLTTIALLAGLTFISSCGSLGPKRAQDYITKQELKVGDKMPEPTGHFYLGKILLPYNRNHNIAKDYYKNPEQNKFLIICNDKDLIHDKGNIPFAFYDFNTKTLVIDNKDKNRKSLSDGIVDNVIHNFPKKDLTSHNILLHAPQCPD